MSNYDIVIKCPECGEVIEWDEDASENDCDKCETTFIKCMERDSI